MTTIDDLKTSFLPFGEENTGLAEHFSGKSYLAVLTTEQVRAYNVSFEPGCRNSWHIHHATSGGGQVLIVTAGRGWYQAWGEPARALGPGDVVNVPAGLKHWHGAAADSAFQHIALEVPGEDGRTEWLEPVSQADYDALG
ncbi:cupin domain-containing protein [Actinomyces lilanjuaniae]|uniref:Cupin domain-containing protein n=1 Tax=Actinomyces lilanjuaniae TaxID=2321394 RepID=A0ABM6Z1S4_9ACTO|nr:cupin domain-containing protein [Actinomyces lilanjuaniae]AYD89116.1 cupin domain-containing protein [Actinomyces lilanjuaniae]